MRYSHCLMKIILLTLIAFAVIGSEVDGDTITVDSQVFTIIESPAEALGVTPTSEQSSAGVIPYQRNNYSEYVHELSSPQSGQVISHLDFSAARGETESTRVLVYAMQDFTDLVFRYEGSTTTQAIPASWISLAQIPFRYQRLTYESTNVHKAGKIIFPFSSNLRFYLNDAHTRIFYVTINVPSDALAGNYGGNLIIGSDGGAKISVPLNVKVHSFDLIEPDEKIGYYVGYWQTLNDVYDWMKGANAYAASMTLQSPTLINQNGHWVIDSSDIIEKVQGYINAGMAPPLPLELTTLSTALSIELGLYDSLEKDPVTDSSHLICPRTEEDYPQELRDAYSYAITDLWNDLAAYNLEDAVVFYPIDEPTANYHRMPMAKVITNLIHQATPDAEIYITVGDVTRTQELATDGYIDIASVVLGELQQDYASWQTLSQQYDIALWSYTGTPATWGSGAAVSGLGLDRLIYWISYIGRCNADDPYNDLRSTTSAAGFFLPSSTGYKNTLDFEVVRESIDDLRYIATAQQAIETMEASSDPVDQLRAQYARTDFDALKASFLDYTNLDKDVCENAQLVCAQIVEELSSDLTISPFVDNSFEVNVQGSRFTNWGLGRQGSVSGESGATFETYASTYTNNTTVSGSNSPYRKASLVVPFDFSKPIVSANVFFNSEARQYANHNGYAAIYITVDGVETLIYKHANSDLISRGVLTAAEGYYNYDGVAPTGDGICSTSTDITNLVQGETEFSIRFESQLGWSIWLYNGGVFMASDGDEPDFKLSGMLEGVALAGDANDDGAVDVGDLGILAANYGTYTGGYWAIGDFNGDGAVDVGDLGILAANYGTNSSSANWDADFAAVFGDEDEEVNGFCAAFGLPLIAGILLMGMMLGCVKPTSNGLRKEVCDSGN